MGSLGRSQLLVYGAVGVALLLLGARWIRSAHSQGSPAGGVSYSTGAGSSSDSGSGSFAVDAQGGEDVVVDVAGEVNDPGVYRLPAGSRVNDAVQRAGGAAPKANVEGINLAARLSDGQQVVMPSRAPAAAGVVTGGAGAGAGAFLALVGLAGARARRGILARATWIGLASLAAAVGGLAVGGWRLAAIDGGAFRGPVGRPARVRGFVTAVPHRANGEVSV